VRREFRALEQESPTKSQLIYSQVRTFYLMQKDLGLPKAEIYQNIVAWFRNVTKTNMIEAPEVTAAACATLRAAVVARTAGPHQGPYGVRFRV
jgi:hypothetical protein